MSRTGPRWKRVEKSGEKCCCDPYFISPGPPLRLQDRYCSLFPTQPFNCNGVAHFRSNPVQRLRSSFILHNPLSLLIQDGHHAYGRAISRTGTFIPVPDSRSLILLQKIACRVKQSEIRVRSRIAASDRINTFFSRLDAQVSVEIRIARLDTFAEQLIPCR